MPARGVRAGRAHPTVGNPASMMPDCGLSATEIEAIIAYLGSLRR